MCHLSRSPCTAVNAARGTEAACSHVTFSASWPLSTRERKHTQQRSPGSEPRLEHPSLRVTAPREEPLVAWLELRDVPAHHFSLAGYISAGSCIHWFAQPGQYASAV